jgi:hypothetical protein
MGQNHNLSHDSPPYVRLFGCRGPRIDGRERGCFSISVIADQKARQATVAELFEAAALAEVVAAVGLKARPEVAREVAELELPPVASRKPFPNDFQ